LNVINHMNNKQNVSLIANMYIVAIKLMNINTAHERDMYFLTLHAHGTTQSPWEVLVIMFLMNKHIFHNMRWLIVSF
ncbi:hypothetical protein ACJX0J_034080, partial [Zea mays]